MTRDAGVQPAIRAHRGRRAAGRREFGKIAGFLFHCIENRYKKLNYRELLSFFAFSPRPTATDDRGRPTAGRFCSFGEKGEMFFGGDPGKGGGKAIKRAFAKNADHQPNT